MTLRFDTYTVYTYTCVQNTLHIHVYTHVYTYHIHTCPVLARNPYLSKAVPLAGRAGAEEASSRAGGRAAVTGAVPESELVSAISYTERNT